MVKPLHSVETCFDTTTGWKMCLETGGVQAVTAWYSECVLCLCTVTDDSSDVVGGGHVACQGHAKDLQRVFTSKSGSGCGVVILFLFLLQGRS